ncbi:type III effector protein [Streptomyces sp. Inha503]|uniref:type III effector protein n=1 Tax=Streptomyces sp. Inha503 TaxID=3383314 RepID=UPI00399FE117
MSARRAAVSKSTTSPAAVRTVSSSTGADGSTAAATVRPSRSARCSAGVASLSGPRIRGFVSNGGPSACIETARAAGASWADLAHPLGVASRQAAERQYLRGQPGPTGTTGEQRVQATRERRAADRPLTAWARNNAADLRRIAGQITALTELPAAARGCVSQLDAALAQDDPAALVRPRNATRPYLTHLHPDLAARLDALTDTTSAASD